MPPFAFRKAAFYSVKACLLHHERYAFACSSECILVFRLFDKAIIKAEECFIYLGVRYRIYEHKIVFDMLPVIISVSLLKGEK